MPPYIVLLGLGFFCLPLTKALTIDIGFPLKTYEIFFVGALLTYPFTRHGFDTSFAKKLYTPLFAAWLVSVIAFFAFAYADVSVIGLGFRGGPYLDGLARTAYFLLNILILVALTSRPQLSIEPFLIECWLWGMAMSCAFSVYCVLSYLLTGEAILLPGLERHQLGYIGPIAVSRSGTFEEGNFGGLYFLLSMVLALRGRRFIFAGVALVGLVLTQSTAAYFGLITVGGVYLMLSRRNALTFIPYFFVGVIAAFGVFVYFAEQGKFGYTGNASGAVRLNEAMTGINTWLTSPIHGVGLGQFGFNYYQNVWNAALVAEQSSERHIVNVVYIELLAEIGILGLLAMVIFWVRWMKMVKRDASDSRIIYASAFGMMVSFLAYPTFNIAFLWCYLGLAVILCKSGSQRRWPRGVVTESPSAATSLVGAR